MHWTEPATADDSHAALEMLWDAANMLWAGADLKPSDWSGATKTTRKGSPKGERGGAHQYSPTVLGLIFLRYADVRFAAVRHPDLPTQRKIASILSAYDDLIENNLRRIKILEQMVQSLYREWFVHFRFPRDPSEASAKAGGHESATFKDSELGRIPEGWEVMPVEALLDSHIGGGWGKELQDDKHSKPAFVIRGTDIPDARECGVSGVPFRFHSASNLKSRRLEPDNIVFEVSGGSKGQPVGRSPFVSDRLLNAFGGADVMCASFCKLLRPRAEILAPKLLLYHFLEIYEDGRIDAYQVQSTGITNFKFAPFLEQEMIIVPPHDLQMKWRAIADDLLGEASLLGAKNQNLRRTRDLLLPKLLTSDE